MKTILSLCLCAIVLTSCQTNSLQSYMVDHKSDENFISVDFSLKTFVDNFDNLDPEQKEVFEDINKVNFLAFKKNSSNDNDYTSKRQQLIEILSDEFSEGQLMSMNMDGNQVKMYADNIDKQVQEIVLFASNNDKGFLVARLLGDNLNPENFMKMAKMSGNMDFESLSSMINM